MRYSENDKLMVLFIVKWIFPIVPFPASDSILSLLRMLERIVFRSVMFVI